jgi:hypothetical protein
MDENELYLHLYHHNHEKANNPHADGNVLSLIATC